MAKWDKQYKVAAGLGDLTRKLGFVMLKHADGEETHDKLVDDMENLVEEQIKVERRNADKQWEKGLNIGILVGGVASLTGIVIGEMINYYSDKKV